MKTTRLLLELERGDYIYFTVEGCDEPIGTIKLSDHSPLAYATMVFEFAPAIKVVRGRALAKARKKKK